MEQRRLGNTDLVCSAIGFGTWEMGSHPNSFSKYGHIDPDEAATAVNAAVDRGVTLFDTAAIYGAGVSEELLARALGPRRKDVIIVTKLGFDIADSGEVRGKHSGRSVLIPQMDRSLQRLRTDYVDLLLLHWHDHETPFAETMGALMALKAAGKCRQIGVCNLTLPQLLECEQYAELAAFQTGYHMYDRRVEREILPHCLAKGIGFMSYGTLGFGLLTGAFTPETRFVDWDWRSRGMAFGLPLFQPEQFARELAVVERLREFAARSGHTVAQLAIAWALGHPAVWVSLVGIRRLSELEENVAAADWRLTADERAELDGIFAAGGAPPYYDWPLAT